MKVTPHIVADFEEYPELAKLADAAIRRVVELMEIHDISEIRRLRKVGVYEHPYVKDIVTELGVPSAPSTISAARYAAGKAMLDYLETIGISGLAITLSSKDELFAIDSLWSGKRPEQPNTQPNDPQPVEQETEPKPAAEDVKPAAENGSENTKKENEDGQAQD